MENQVDVTPNLPRQRKWKITFITLTICTVAFYIIGGALVGASLNCSTTYSTYLGSYYSVGCVDAGKYYGGCALVAIASVLFLVWLIFLILRFTSWYRGPRVVVQNFNAAPAQPQVTGETKAPETVVSPVEQQPANQTFCTTCEHPINGAFCGNCGTKVQ